ncbi:YwqG family protein [Paenibacillus sp. NPDC058174]|uniref:YwqG family protein n=1 Tax=Paenibacillus sp. NPDC058174 TaxID=3346366 RepID=UPI0036DE48A5
MSAQEILDLLEQSGLEQYKTSIAQWIFPTAQIILEPKSDALFQIGESKIGGDPDLLEEVDWPKWKSYDMTFIGQLNLAQCPSHLSLPSAGLLSFFYAVEGMYEDPDFYGDPHTCRVIYTSPDQLDHLVRRSAPASLKEGVKMQPNSISFLPSLSVPATESAYLESIGLGWNEDQDDINKYWEIFLPKTEKLWQREGYINRLMGHPDQIQGDMQRSCEIAYGSYTDNELDKADFIKSALKWRLLLQIDSEEEKTGIMWGDVGRIYYWIHEDDLAQLRFDRVFCEMQCG